jgi:hypothetical protein
MTSEDLTTPLAYLRRAGIARCAGPACTAALLPRGMRGAAMLAWLYLKLTAPSPRSLCGGACAIGTRTPQTGPISTVLSMAQTPAQLSESPSTSSATRDQLPTRGNPRDPIRTAAHIGYPGYVSAHTSFRAGPYSPRKDQRAVS